MKTWFTLLSLALFSITAAQADIQSLEKNLQKNFPDMPAKSIHSTPLPGIYEVYMGGRIVYTNEQGRYFMVGSLIDLPEQKNLTEEREQILKRIDVKQLPLNQAIKQVKGNGKRVIYIFSDPDCPYCQKLELELAKLNNVTLYLFIMPLKELHPNAEAISKQIWCSKKPAQAWTDYTINKKQPSAKDSCETPIEKNIELAKKLEITGTPTLFLKDGTRLSGAIPADELDKMLDQLEQ